MAETYLTLPDSDDVFVADTPEQADAALREGYQTASPEQISAYDSRKAYQESTSRVERELIGAGVGATTQLLGVPALAAKYTGIDETASGGSWLAQFASQMGGIPIEQAEQALREVSDAAPDGFFAGQVAGSVLGTKGLTAGGSALAARAGIDVAGKMALAGTVAESMAQHVTMAAEQAFVENRELSAETILAASILGGAGPLALGPGLSALGKAGRKGLEKVDAARLARFEASQPAQMSLAGIGPAAKPPVRLADLLSPSRKSRFEALAGAADELGEAAAAGAASLAGPAAQAARRAFHGPGVRMGGFGHGGSTTGAFLGAVSMDGLLGAAVGGAAGLAVQKFGPRAAGWVLGNVANGMRSLAAESAKKALSGTAKAVAPKDLLVRTALAGGANYRVNLLSMIDDSRETVKAAAANPEHFVASIGETYGDLDPDMVRSITDSHLRAIQYLQKSIPPQPRLNPTMPQMGRANVPLRHAESYARKLRAVTDPMTLLQDLSDGTLHEDTVEAVRSVYPSMYLEIEAQALSALADLDQVVTRRQAVALDKLFQNGGLVYPPRDPGFQARLAVIAETQRQAAGGHDSAPMKPGRPKGSPTLGQSMRTSSQRISATMGN